MNMHVKWNFINNKDWDRSLRQVRGYKNEPTVVFRRSDGYQLVRWVDTLVEETPDRVCWTLHNSAGKTLARIFSMHMRNSKPPIVWADSTISAIRGEAEL